MLRRIFWLVLAIALLVTPWSAAADAPPLDLNQATVAQLVELPGIGPKRAEDIIRYRLLRNGFKRASDLLRIKGIGKRIYRKIRPLIYVKRLEPK